MKTGFSIANSDHAQAHGQEFLIAGLGGMGVVGLTRQLGSLLGSRHSQVFSKESRGIAQRRASVLGSVRAGSSVHSPELYFGSAHYLIGLEPLEALRYLSFVRLGTLCLLSDRRILPSGLKGRDFQYPGAAAIQARLAHRGGETYWLPVTGWLQEEGLEDRYASSAMLGALAALLGYSERAVAELPGGKKDRERVRQYEALTWGYRYLRHTLDESLDRSRAAVV